jgi:soluble lytic murein transglycosylase-like protein
MKHLLPALALTLALACAKPVHHEPARRIDPAIIEAIVVVESGGNPRAIGQGGTIGLCQILPATGHSLGYTREELFDPVKNREAAEKYLTLLLDRFGDLTLALQAYNCGTVKYMEPKCRAYAQRVLRRL